MRKEVLMNLTEIVKSLTDNFMSTTGLDKVGDPDGRFRISIENKVLSMILNVSANNKQICIEASTGANEFARGKTNYSPAKKAMHNNALQQNDDMAEIGFHQLSLQAKDELERRYPAKK